MHNNKQIKIMKIEQKMEIKVFVLIYDELMYLQIYAQRTPKIKTINK